MLRFKETYECLFVILFDLRWHDWYALIQLLWRSKLKFDRLVTRALDLDAEGDVARDLGEVLRVRVVERNPLVLHHVVLLVVDLVDGKFEPPDQIALEEATVFNTDDDGGLVKFLTGDAWSLDEHVFIVSGGRISGNVFLRMGPTLLAEDFNTDKRVANIVKL